MRKNKIPNEQDDPEGYTNYIFKLLHKQNKTRLREECTAERMHTYGLLRECCKFIHVPGYSDCFDILVEIGYTLDDYSATATDALHALVMNKDWFRYIGKSDLAEQWGLQICYKLLNLGADINVINSERDFIYDNPLTITIKHIKTISDVYNYAYRKGYIDENYTCELWFKINCFCYYLDQRLCFNKINGYNLFDNNWNRYLQFPNLNPRNCTTPIFSPVIVPNCLQWCEKNKNEYCFKKINSLILKYFDKQAKSRFFGSLGTFTCDKTVTLTNIDPSAPQAFIDILKQKISTTHNNTEIKSLCLEWISEFAKNKPILFEGELSELRQHFNVVLADYVILPYL